MSTPPFARKYNSSTSALDIVKNVDLTNHTYAITGATHGLGYETARTLVLANAHVVMFVRNLKTADEVKAQITAEKSDAKIDIIECDLASLKNVKQAAEQFLAKGWPLHCLILNAGLVNAIDVMSQDYLETTVAVNHLAGYYLCKLLLPKLIEIRSQSKTDPLSGRVVIVSSEAHRSPGVPDDLSANQMSEELLFGKPKSSGTSMSMKLYGTSKLCNVWMAKWLHANYCTKGIRAYSLHPGTMVKTNIASSSIIASAFMWLLSPFTKTVQQGAATQVYCACDKELDTYGSGMYFRDCWPLETTPLGNNNILMNVCMATCDAVLKEKIGV